MWLFFQSLSYIVNFVDASTKRHSQLKSIRDDEIVDLIATGEVPTGTGANHVCTLQRAGAIRWSSHFASIKRLIEMFSSTCTLLANLINEGSNDNIRGEVKGALKVMKTFECVFILLLMHEVLENLIFCVKHCK